MMQKDSRYGKRKREAVRTTRSAGWLPAPMIERVPIMINFTFDLNADTVLIYFNCQLN
ncbi:hypothetical protein [Undibacterium sp. RuTC16W]|uniref:hypothetical protein n=1 Tax=Undibacterium sp. RuTC16W TaxID=3413048 RepID=UPI003BF0E0C1